MITVLVATPPETLDALMLAEDRQRLESVARVVWRTDLVAGVPEEAYAKALAEEKAEIVMVGWGSPPLAPAVLEKAPSLKYLINITGTLKSYVHRECLAAGLVVTNWGNVIAASVAEASLMMILASLRRAYYWQACLHERKAWREDEEGDRWTPLGLFDKTVGLYGYGPIARALVPTLLPFEPEILVLSSFLDDTHVDRYGLKPVKNLKELFSRSDIVSIHTGKRPDTHHSVNAEVLAAMPDGGIVVNTARGAIVDTDALVAELRSGRLFAALDVFEEEPLPADHPLRGLPNCLLFPHQAGPTKDFCHRCGATAVDQVTRYVKGDELLHQVSLEQYDRAT